MGSLLIRGSPAAISAKKIAPSMGTINWMLSSLCHLQSVPLKVNKPRALKSPYSQSRKIGVPLDPARGCRSIYLEKTTVWFWEGWAACFLQQPHTPRPQLPRAPISLRSPGQLGPTLPLVSFLAKTLERNRHSH